MIHVDTALAGRLEAVSAQELASFYEASRRMEPVPSSALTRMAGGVATYLTPGSPLNHAVGIGFGETVTPADVMRLEEFFASRDERAVATLCPLADPSTFEAFGARGWTLNGFENVLVRAIDAYDSFEHAVDQSVADGIEIAEATDEEQRDQWAHLAAIGFSAPLDPLPEQLWVAAVAAARPESRLFLGYVNGMAAGTGELLVEEGVAWLSADTTLPVFRRRGVQQALQRARLKVAAAAGCTLAVSEAYPGSGSQRNMERLGFRVAYTRVELVAPAT